MRISDWISDVCSSDLSDGKTQHVGIEAGIATPLFWNFDIAAAATYAKHTYDFDHHPVGAAEQIYKGDDIDTAPRTIANVRLGYSFADDKARTELEWVHMGAYWEDAGNTHRYGGHDIFNLRAEYSLTENLS